MNKLVSILLCLSAHGRFSEHANTNGKRIPEKRPCHPAGAMARRQESFKVCPDKTCYRLISGTNFRSAYPV
jgi:hypothetical protein